jgi:HK97 gp10 family phage protein
MADAASVDLQSLAADFAYASNQGMAQAATEVIRQAAQSIQQQAQANAPVRTGRLRDSITIHYTDVFRASIGPTVPYGVFQEYGTGSRGEFGGPMYTIRPKRAGGVLVFTVNGKKVVARVVHHPGIPPHPFMRPAVAQVLGQELTASLAERGALLITQGKNR